MLNSIAPKLLCVRDNCDSEVDQMVLGFPIMAEYILVCDGEHSFLATHGHHLESVCAPLKSGTVLFGHTHLPADFVENGLRMINPGSVSIPKNGSRHSYMLCRNGVFVFKDVESGAEYTLPR